MKFSKNKMKSSAKTVQQKHSQIREAKREDWEQNLQFAGFVVISCPLKPDTKAMIKEIMESSHKVRTVSQVLDGLAIALSSFFYLS